MLCISAEVGACTMRIHRESRVRMQRACTQALWMRARIMRGTAWCVQRQNAHNDWWKRRRGAQQWRGNPLHPLRLLPRPSAAPNHPLPPAVHVHASHLPPALAGMCMRARTRVRVRAGRRSAFTSWFVATCSSGSTQRRRVARTRPVVCLSQ
jgi:hypothetical protein